MKVSTLNGVKRINVEPGEYYSSTTPLVLSTILGSCVSCCLYDEHSGVFGMNHFLISSPISDRQVFSSDAGRYGIHAMELLINSMLKLGAKRQSLKAKCFGGADILEIQHTKIGRKNIAFVRDFLTIEKIPLIGSDMGANVGRLIHFFGEDYSVYVKRNDKKSQKQIIRNSEQRYYEKLTNESNDVQNKLTSKNIEYW